MCRRARTGIVNAAATAAAKTIVVRTTVQAAIDEAAPGDTIHVPPGVYRENVRVAKDRLTVRGSLAAVLDGSGLARTTGIRVASSQPAGRITGFTLEGNVALQNGANPDPRLGPLPGADLLWDTTGLDNCWSENIAKVVVPDPLPACQASLENSGDRRASAHPGTP